jgi:hypothetical protein
MVMDQELPRGVFTVVAKREHVLAYLGQAHGCKGEYLRRHGLTEWQIRKWRAGLYAGTLEVGLVPRDSRFPDAPDQNRELVRLSGQVQALQQQLAEARAAHEVALAELRVAHDEQLADKQAEVDAGRVAVEALGKAIALLQSGNGSAGSTTGS